MADERETGTKLLPKFDRDGLITAVASDEASGEGGAREIFFTHRARAHGGARARGVSAWKADVYWFKTHRVPKNILAHFRFFRWRAFG